MPRKQQSATNGRRRQSEPFLSARKTDKNTQTKDR